MTPFTSEHKMFRAMVRQWVENEIAPNAEEWDEAGIFPAELFKKAGDLGLFGIRHDPEWGGSGLDYWYVTILVEELARGHNAGAAMALMVQAEMATPIINEIGTDEQKELFLKPALAGDKIAALGVSEPDVGSDVAGLKTTARKDGGDYVINGSKMWITNGTRADFITLAVRTGDDGFGGVSLVTFPTDVKGYEIGKSLKKVGNLSSDTAILYFDNCRIPQRYVLGEENMGFYHIMTNFQGERLVGALSGMAAMDNMLEEAIQYGHERSAFGRPIIKFQVWRHKFVEHLAGMEAARQLCYHATDLFNKYITGESDYSPVKEISMAKLFACDLAQKVAYDCQQFHGGMGYVTETNIARGWRDVRLLTVGGGTSEIMKEIIAKGMGI